jgi:hypothetical protein
MNRSSPSWSARTGRSPERDRTGRRTAGLPKFVCFGAEAKTLGDYAALDYEATGDEIHDKFQRRLRNAGRRQALRPRKFAIRYDASAERSPTRLFLSSWPGLRTLI